MPGANTQPPRALADRIAEYAHSRFRRGIETRTTGSMVLLNRSADDLALHAHSMHAAAPEIDEAGNAKDAPASRQPRRRLRRLRPRRQPRKKRSRNRLPDRRQRRRCRAR